MYTTNQQARESNRVEHRKPAHAFVWIRALLLLFPRLITRLYPLLAVNSINIIKEGKNLMCCSLLLDIDFDFNSSFLLKILI